MAAKLKIEKKGDEILIVHCCFSLSQNENYQKIPCMAPFQNCVQQPRGVLLLKIEIAKTTMFIVTFFDNGMTGGHDLAPQG
jgi:hypothetical protein